MAKSWDDIRARAMAFTERAFSDSKIWACTKCHHEWQSSEKSICSWCGGEGRELGPAYPKRTNYATPHEPDLCMCGQRIGHKLSCLFTKDKK